MLIRDGHDGPTAGTPRTLIQVPEFESTLWRGVIFTTLRTNVRSAFLPMLREAIRTAREETGSPVAAMAIYQLDRRFPLDIDFASNVDELTAMFQDVHASFSAVANVIEFDGIFASTLEGFCRLIGAAVPVPPSRTFRSRVLAMHWLMPFVRHRDGAATFEQYLAVPPPDRRYRGVAPGH